MPLDLIGCPAITAREPAAVESQRRHPGLQTVRSSVACLRHPKKKLIGPDVRKLLRTERDVVAEPADVGAEIEWPALLARCHPRRRQRIDTLPTHRAADCAKRQWIERLAPTDG